MHMPGYVHSKRGILGILFEVFRSMSTHLQIPFGFWIVVHGALSSRCVCVQVASRKGAYKIPASHGTDT